jgi:hypothetical protein
LEDQKFDLSTINLSVDGDSLLTRFFSENGALQKRIPTECLITLDPMSGDKIDETSPATENERDPTKESEIGVIVSTHKANSSASTRQAKVIPERVEEKGRVGFEVTWSDGSRFIYRRRVIALAAGGTIIESKI